MSSDDFELASRRLLEELHSRLVAEHQHQVEVITTRPVGPARPEKTEPIVPQSNPPSLAVPTTPITSNTASTIAPACGRPPSICLPVKIDSCVVEDFGDVEASHDANSRPAVLQLETEADDSAGPGVVKSPSGVRFRSSAFQDEAERTLPSTAQDRSGLKKGSRTSVALRSQSTDDLNGGIAAPYSTQSSLKSSNTPKPSRDDHHSGRSSHVFEALDVWVSQTNRRRLFSFRSKSVILTSKAEDMAEMITEDGAKGFIARSASRWMISPSTMKHVLWDLLGLLMIGYDSITVPMEVFEPEDIFFLVMMRWMGLLYWFVNIPVTFLTGFLLTNGAMEMRPGRVAKKYVITWLPLDLFTLLIDVWAMIMDMTEALDPLSTILRVMRIIRVVRLVRLVKAPAITGFVNEHIRSEEVLISGTIFQIIFLMLGVAHFVACAWYAVGRFCVTDPGESSWVKQEDIQNGKLGQRYAWSFHWSLSIIAGELISAPQNESERIFTIFACFFSIFLSASFVSGLTSAMTQLQIIARDESSRFSALRRYLLDQSISRPLAIRIQRNARHAVTEEKRNAPESKVDLLNMISNPLLVELHFEIYSGVLMEHPFFELYHDVNPGGIRKVCHIAVSVLPLSAGDVLFRDLEVPTHKRMYFVTRGEIEYKKETEPPILVAKPTWLCEAVLWTPWTHCGTARACTDSRLTFLDADQFQDVVSTFPSEHACEYAQCFVNVLNSRGSEELTDLALAPDLLQEMIDQVFPAQEEENSDDEAPFEAAESQKERASTSMDSIESHPITKLASLGSFLSGSVALGASAVARSGSKSARTAPQKEVRILRWRFSSEKSPKRSHSAKAQTSAMEHARSSAVGIVETMRRISGWDDASRPFRASNQRRSMQSFRSSVNPSPTLSEPSREPSKNTLCVPNG